MGDVNQDGIVSGDGTGPTSSDDTSAFIARFGTTGHQSLLDQYTSGDQNSDGATDLFDWLILYENHIDSSALNLSALLQRAPEPASCVSPILGGLSLSYCRQR